MGCETVWMREIIQNLEHDGFAGCHI